MKALFLKLTEEDRNVGVLHVAHVLSETDGRLLAVVTGVETQGGERFVCGCWPSPKDGWDCEHILIVKAAPEVAQAGKPRSAA